MVGTTDGEDGVVGEGEGYDGKGLKEKKGDKVEKLESWRRTPVQPVSAMRGEIGAKDKEDRFEEAGAGRGGKMGGGGEGKSKGLMKREG